MPENRANFGGMTVNERLVVANLLGAWDSAIEAANRSRAIELLARVDLPYEPAAATVDAVLANPTEYGFPRRPNL